MNKEKYVCPMHADVVSDKPGVCSKCGMKLEKVGNISNEVTAEHKDHATENKKSKLATYKPLIIIVGLISLVTFALAIKDFQLGTFSLSTALSYFMAVFFLVFAGFKLLDIKGFAHGYSTYDLLARKIPQYGYVYPFIELSLGLAYLVQFEPIIVNLVTIAVMGFSGLGVIRSIMKKIKFQCVCLGTLIKVPLTSVTIIEDFGMSLMALIMFLILYF